MKNYIGMVVLRPDINNEQMDFIQSDIISLFKQKAKVQMVWFLGKRKLDYKLKKHSEGIYLKFEILAKENKIEQLKEELKKNQNVIFFFVIQNENTQKDLHKIVKTHLPFSKGLPVANFQTNQPIKKVYLLVKKNIKLPFSESDIIAISEDIQKIFQHANSKIQEFVFTKNYFTTKKFNTIKDVENELKKTWKVEFVLGDNQNVGQQLLIQEKYLI